VSVLVTHVPSTVIFYFNDRKKANLELKSKAYILCVRFIINYIKNNWR